MSVMNGAGGGVQQELSLRREISDLEEKLKTITDSDQRVALRKGLMDKRLKLSVHEEARRK